MIAPAIQVRGLTVTHGGVPAIESASFAIEPGSYTVVAGPSGAGKTTLLLALGGFLTPSNGEMRFAGEDVIGLPPARRPTVTVFADDALFPHLSVAQNVAFGLRMQGMATRERKRRVREALGQIGLADVADKRPAHLTAEQARRVALARAMIVDPKLVLLDEPAGRLAPDQRAALREELRRQQRLTGATFLHATRDAADALALADNCIVLNNGRIDDQGPTERLYQRPASRFTATFLGEANVLTGKVVELGTHEIQLDTTVGALTVPGFGEPGFDISAVIRPQHIGLDEKPGALSLGEAMVTETEFQGGLRRVVAVSLKNRSQSFVAAISGARPVSTGDVVRLYCNPVDVVLVSR